MAKYKVEVNGKSFTHDVDVDNEGYINAAKYGMIAGRTISAGLKIGATRALVRSNVKNIWKLVGGLVLGSSAVHDLDYAAKCAALTWHKIDDEEETEYEGPVEVVDNPWSEDENSEEPLN